MVFAGSAAQADGQTAPDYDWAETPFARLLNAQTFTCSGRTCGEMRSCAEACHALLVCGDRRRDGDNDGIPCENLCNSRC